MRVASCIRANSVQLCANTSRRSLYVADIATTLRENAHVSEGFFHGLERIKTKEFPWENGNCLINCSVID